MRSKFLAGSAALALTATAVLASAGPASAQRWHRGFGLPWLAAGVVGGAVAAATSPLWAPGYYGYYGNQYPRRAYAPGYAYDDSYAYEPGYTLRNQAGQHIWACSLRRRPLYTEHADAGVSPKPRFPGRQQGLVSIVYAPGGAVRPAILFVPVGRGHSGQVSLRPSAAATQLGSTRLN